MRLLFATCCLSLCLLACAIDGAAQTSATQTAPAKQGCAIPEFSQLDFWLGDWDAFFEGGQGVNRITKVLDGCVVQEDFTGGPATDNLIGHSVSTFQRGIGQWRQTWVDNNGGYFALVGGPVGDAFILTNTRVRDNAPYLRMVFEDIKPESFTWRWQNSADAGVRWVDSWVIQYRRRKP